ncbi:MAG: hypothetical protein EHM45_13100 [Desulfobacteraceae bacterium]|nr:MAG: hypothetical protein EHM45_13100 [Desulfobacteraceae bacterium]
MLALSGPVHALPPGVDFEVKGDLLSVDLSDVSLMDILNKLKTTKGIWYKAEPAQLGERVTARFQSVPLERGLRRILTAQDYCLYFDNSGKLIGINLIKKDLKEVQRGVAGFRPPEPPRNTPFTPSLPPQPSGPLYIPKPNPPMPAIPEAPRTVPPRPPVIRRVPAPPRLTNPVPPPPKPPIPMLPEPPDEEDPDDE